MTIPLTAYSSELLIWRSARMDLRATNGVEVSSRKVQAIKMSPETDFWDLRKAGFYYFGHSCSLYYHRMKLTVKQDFSGFRTPCPQPVILTRNLSIDDHLRQATDMGNFWMFAIVYLLIWSCNNKLSVLEQFIAIFYQHNLTLQQRTPVFLWSHLLNEPEAWD